MRALLITATAALAVGVLAGCGDASTQAASDQTTTTTTSEEPKTTPAVPVPSGATTTPPPSEAGKPQDPSGGEPPVTIGEDGPVVPEEATEVPAAQVDAKALPTNVEYGNTVWQYNDGFSLQILTEAKDGCTSMEAMVVDQSPDAVKIVVRAMDEPQGGRPDDEICTMAIRPVSVTVTLDQPLRDRQVLLSAGR